jgi:hypothetical protein
MPMNTALDGSKEANIYIYYGRGGLETYSDQSPRVMAQYGFRYKKKEKAAIYWDVYHATPIREQMVCIYTYLDKDGKMSISDLPLYNWNREDRFAYLNQNGELVVSGLTFSDLYQEKQFRLKEMQHANFFFPKQQGELPSW